MEMFTILNIYGTTVLCKTERGSASLYKLQPGCHQPLDGFVPECEFFPLVNFTFQTPLRSSTHLGRMQEALIKSCWLTSVHGPLNAT